MTEAENGSGRSTVLLVDEQGRALGASPKLAAHEPPGQLHLAFSVFLFDDAGRVLWQRRAAEKYHFPLVWANSCCSHPAPGEDPKRSAVARVEEELGLGCALEGAGHFVYRAACARSGLVEHEYDLVFVGGLTGTPEPDPEEVAEVRLLEPAAVRAGGLGGELAPWVAEALRLAEAAWRSSVGG